MCIRDSLEPATNYPNQKRFERQQGRVVRIAGRGSYDVTLTVGAYATRAAIRGIEQEIQRIQGRRKTVVNQQLQPHLSDLG